MDIEKGDYIVPPEIAVVSRVEIPGIFEDSWEGKPVVPIKEWQIIGDYIESHLSDKAILSYLEQK